MADDLKFRLVLLGVLGVFFPFAIFYRLRSRTSEKLDRKQEGTGMLWGLRSVAAIMMGCFFAWMINPDWLRFAAMPLPNSVRWGGIVVSVLWIGLHLWTLHHLGKNLTDTVIVRKEATLVTTGPYRYIRHPFYLAFLLAIIGFSFATANILFALLGLIIYALLVIRTTKEEVHLLKRFGDKYQHYMQTTARFFPRLW